MPINDPGAKTKNLPIRVMFHVKQFGEGVLKITLTPPFS
jgi:hypothetical protein